MFTGGLDIVSSYPFSAIYGSEEAKNALLCALINPSIRSVLIVGPSGTAKTILSRSVSGYLSGRRVINIPLNVTEEQLFGGLDFQATLESGIIKEMPGLLGRSDGNIVYIDDANLIDSRLLTSLLDAIFKGEIILEREGISSRRPCSTLLIATMNLEEAELNDCVMDRFDLCAHMTSHDEHDAREEILRRNMLFYRNPLNFKEHYSNEDTNIVGRINRARQLLPHILLDDEALQLITELCAEAGAEGHRAGITMAHASIALAALDERGEVNLRDVENAAKICLSHRWNSDLTTPPINDQGDDHRDLEYVKGNEDSNNDNPEGDNSPNHEIEFEPDLDNPKTDPIDDILFEIGATFEVIDYLSNHNIRKITRSRKGKRSLVESDDSSGRYVRPRVPGGTPRDVAFDATIRAAAPYQTRRDRNGLMIVIEEQDIREKVRERRCGYTILFLVDASGSLGVRRRMAAVKGAVFSMLQDSYVQRDHIGLMAFRRDSAEMILPPTRSAEYAYQRLDDLPTGGKTPLATALITASEFMNIYSRAHPGEKCSIVLVTDGRANVPMSEGSDANEEVLKIAENITTPRVKWVVIDTESGRVKLGNASRLADKLGADIFLLDELSADNISKGIRSALECM
ncbi:MAG: VWA domain-containing protein [Euryarchaeota archaeon]|mgnify:CR=1 FL=1|nr:VWA domain-containing protein [Euryarchaeota archaeon]